MGGKLSKKVLTVFYEKPVGQRVEEEATEATMVKPESEEIHPATESMGPTTEEGVRDSQVPAVKTEDKEGGELPVVSLDEACKPEPKRLDLLPNEKQLMAAVNEETAKSPETDPSQLLEETELKGVEHRQERDAE